MKIEIFEDAHIQSLHPLTLLRSAASIRSGGTTLTELISKVEQEVAKKGTGTLYINSRAIPSYEHMNDTITLAKKGKEFCLTQDKYTVAMYLTKGTREKNAAPKEKGVWPLFSNLHDVVMYNTFLLKQNSSYLAKGIKKYTKAKGVFTGKKFAIDASVRFDTTAGPILLGENVTILPFSYLVGPLVIGENTIVSPHAYIKESSIGAVCKIGGEVTNAVLDNYSNKAHAGFLGHSYVGEWVNLGGGSITSNLKNTYGGITMAGIKTNEQLLGCIIGDLSKVSAGAIISAGKVLGVNTIVYGTVTTDVPSFTNYLNAKNLVECPLEIALTVLARMRARRNIKTLPSYADEIARVFEKTKNTRKDAGVTHGKLEF